MGAGNVRLGSPGSWGDLLRAGAFHISASRFLLGLIGFPRGDSSKLAVGLENVASCQAEREKDEQC